jgi:uncharacterized damage-inducible protein DinB
MSHNQALIAELKAECANTRKMLERIPTEKNEWRPHAKSMTLGRLSQHVAELTGWVTMTLNTNGIDFSKMDYKPKMAATNAELVAELDKNLDEAVAALEKATPEDMQKPWTMQNGDHIYFTLPKAVVMRTWAFNHSYHHRGQLSHYLRQLDIPVPGMYGPSADDKQGA